MTSAELLILGKLALTFGVLLGLPLLELWLLSRDREDNAGDGPHEDSGGERR